jgi:hypothetical protein
MRLYVYLDKFKPLKCKCCVMFGSIQCSNGGISPTLPVNYQIFSHQLMHNWIVLKIMINCIKIDIKRFLHVSV